MLEALAKASAELEKSVTNFTEQLTSFNESVQKSLDEELKAVNKRLEWTIKSNLEELGHNKNLIVKRLMDAERAELETIQSAGRKVRSALNSHAMQTERRIESFIDGQMTELKSYLRQPEEQVRSASQTSVARLEELLRQGNESISGAESSARHALSDKVRQLEELLLDEMHKARGSIAGQLDEYDGKLKSKSEGASSDIDELSSRAAAQIEQKAEDCQRMLETSASDGREKIQGVSEQWKAQVSELCESLDSSLSSLSCVLKEAYESKLSAVGTQARNEIGGLSRQAHERIEATRGELEAAMKDLEREYLDQFQSIIKRLETVVSEHSNDRRNSNVARQHKAQKMRDQMQSHLRRWGASLIDSVKHAAEQLESEFLRSTDGFHQRVESARSAAIELLERESRLMQKDIERTMREFQKEMLELENQLSHIEKAGQDAALTVIAYRKAMLSFGGD